MSSYNYVDPLNFNDASDEFVLRMANLINSDIRGTQEIDTNRNDIREQLSYFFHVAYLKLKKYNLFANAYLITGIDFSNPLLSDDFLRRKIYRPLYNSEIEMGLLKLEYRLVNVNLLNISSIKEIFARYFSVIMKQCSMYNKFLDDSFNRLVGTRRYNEVLSSGRALGLRQGLNFEFFKRGDLMVMHDSLNSLGGVKLVETKLDEQDISFSGIKEYFERVSPEMRTICETMNAYKNYIIMELDRVNSIENLEENDDENLEENDDENLDENLEENDDENLDESENKNDNQSLRDCRHINLTQDLSCIGKEDHVLLDTIEGDNAYCLGRNCYSEDTIINLQTFRDPLTNRNLTEEEIDLLRSIGNLNRPYSGLSYDVGDPFELVQDRDDLDERRRRDDRDRDDLDERRRRADEYTQELRERRLRGERAPRDPRARASRDPQQPLTDEEFYNALRRGSRRRGRRGRR